MDQFPDDKVTDFLLPFEEFNLLIELKAIEMSPIAQVNPTNEVLENELQESVCKGVVQGYSLINSLKYGNDNLNLKNRNEFYLMILTYKNLYLGPSSLVWDEFLKDTVENILIKNAISIDLISPNRIVFLSIEEFDLLVSILWERKGNIKDILKLVEESSGNPKKMKYTFAQYLDDYSSEKMSHPILDNFFSKFIEKIRLHFRI